MRLVFGVIVEAIVALGSLTAIATGAVTGISWLRRRRQEAAQERERMSSDEALTRPGHDGKHIVRGARFWRTVPQLGHIAKIDEYLQTVAAQKHHAPAGRPEVVRVGQQVKLRFFG
jgi:hypothetical protein